ncbi:DUF4190 domain-containing protein [Paenibacillus physcomitrellae]|uniref:DUF4190 domain-containing protein n=1 Tax=Paenibacillus physcomitrellae TaxID=1619311 RepID=A0ABQ1FN87_9BACL|nr:DUF4190 domain-containing protein [Paenibacillus physcomitrellae]GGA20606.1 hypothetical protein GCM10010917_01630 [Paenibacillus physcomitrellae]
MGYGRDDDHRLRPRVNPDHTGDQGTRIDYPRRSLNNEEYAAEFAAVRERKLQTSTHNREANVNQPREQARDQEDSDTGAGQIAGVAGIVLGVLALFMWTIVLGPIAAVLGYYAYSQGKRRVGAWGLALGLLATLSYFVLMPFVR